MLLGNERHVTSPLLGHLATHLQDGLCEPWWVYEHATTATRAGHH